VRIIHVKSAGVLSEEQRQRLETIVYPDMQSAVAKLQKLFPGHTVSAGDGLVRVANRDGSVNVAVFRDENVPQTCVETNFGLRVIDRKTDSIDGMPGL
jgi:hypothetical protein